MSVTSVMLVTGIYNAENWRYRQHYLQHASHVTLSVDAVNPGAVIDRPGKHLNLPGAPIPHLIMGFAIFSRVM
jgi:hypothetical protein